MKFQVLADDADSCNRLAENLRTALKQLHMEFPVELDASPGLAAAMQTESPVLLENGRVIASGKILSAEEIAALLTADHGEEIAALQKAAEREKQRAHLKKGLFLMLAIICGVFAITNEIRQRRAEAAREAANPVVLHFSEPVRILYFYRRPRSQADVHQEVLLRRAVYALYPEEIQRGLLTISSRDAGKSDHAAEIRRYGIQKTPAVILVKKDGTCRELPVRDPENPAQHLARTLDSLK